jgi:ADP-ribose pyrophosphatase YjhB (NUDIX family)
MIAETGLRALAAKMRKRRASRVLIFDPFGAILLIRFEVPRDGGDFMFWALPGGEIEAGESEVEAARREIREELGLDLEMVGPVRVDANQFLHQGEMVDNTDYFFRAFCERDAPRLIGVTAEEIRIMKEIRWWTVAELQRMSERIFPVDLAVWLC